MNAGSNSRWFTIFYGGELTPGFRLGFLTYFQYRSMFYFENSFLKEEFSLFVLSKFASNPWGTLDQIEIGILSCLNEIYPNKGPYYMVRSSSPDLALIENGTHPLINKE